MKHLRLRSVVLAIFNRKRLDAVLRITRGLHVVGQRSFFS